jgi:hypothetical protein
LMISVRSTTRTFLNPPIKLDISGRITPVVFDRRRRLCVQLQTSQVVC